MDTAEQLSLRATHFEPRRSSRSSITESIRALPISIRRALLPANCATPPHIFPHITLCREAWGPEAVPHHLTTPL